MLHLFISDGADMLSRLHRVHSNMSAFWIHLPSFLRVSTMFQVMFMLIEKPELLLHS